MTIFIKYGINITYIEYNSNMESRHEKFKRLATQRTNAVIHKLRLLGNLSVKTNYEYTNEEINKIFSAIESQLRVVKGRFSITKKDEFKL